MLHKVIDFDTLVLVTKQLRIKKYNVNLPTFTHTSANRISCKIFTPTGGYGSILYIPVNSYGHVGMVSSPNHMCVPGQV